jgi:hypothetical protein
MDITFTRDVNTLSTLAARVCHSPNDACMEQTKNIGSDEVSVTNKRSTTKKQKRVKQSTGSAKEERERERERERGEQRAHKSER